MELKWRSCDNVHLFNHLMFSFLRRGKTSTRFKNLCLNVENVRLDYDINSETIKKYFYHFCCFTADIKRRDRVGELIAYETETVWLFVINCKSLGSRQ